MSSHTIRCKECGAQQPIGTKKCDLCNKWFPLPERDRSRSRSRRGEDDSSAPVASRLRTRSLSPGFKTSGRDSRLRNFRDDVIHWPVKDNKGNDIWQGDRGSLGGFSDDLVDEVLDELPSRTTASGVEEFQCPKCKKYVARKRDLGDGAQNWMSIDHKLSIREYVVAHVTAVTDTLDGHLWTYYPKAECIEAHRDPANLRGLCQSCNSSKSGSKDLDGEMRDHLKRECRHKLCRGASDSDEED